MIFPRVEQLQPASCVGDADAGIAEVFPVAAVFHVPDLEMDMVFVRFQQDIDRGEVTCADTILERIFRERQEDHGGNMFSGDVADHGKPDGSFVGGADLLQFDIVVDELHFLFQRHTVVLCFREHIPHDIGQFHHGRGGQVRLAGGQGINIVQRIE